MLFDISDQLFRGIKAGTVHEDYTQYLGEYYD